MHKGPRVSRVSDVTECGWLPVNVRDRTVDVLRDGRDY
jgi:hypothetical protein